jgi:hypothetical protein
MESLVILNSWGEKQGEKDSERSSVFVAGMQQIDREMLTCVLK